MLGTPANLGIIPCALDYIFDQCNGDLEREYSLRMSVMEIYNETVSDLLYPEKGPLKVNESWSVLVII